MKQFNVPAFYRSALIAPIKEARKQKDKLKKDFTPTVLRFGGLEILLARHFGFCYGVENAIEIAFRTLEANPGKRVFFLSEMIHNPQVNQDLQERGVSFLMDTKGKELIPLDSITGDDIVVIPAFGTTLQMEAVLREKGIAIEQYNTTCPFVEKVWNRSAQIAGKGYTVVVHGKPDHEETRATFSHSAANAPTVVIRDMEEAKELALCIRGVYSKEKFFALFGDRCSEGFDPELHLQQIGVVNQTTMLAADTQGIADFLKQEMIQHFNLAADQIATRFADTRDTLCYATNDNQSAVYGMLEEEADLAIVVGGYNSSNTSHLVELCEEKLPTYYINDAQKILPNGAIVHFDFHHQLEKTTEHFLQKMEGSATDRPIRVMITSGASCPDALVEQVIYTLAAMVPNTTPTPEIVY
jgi:4-hydroxy-3-methylbut-2-enyl diphosphate reductase